MTDFASQSPIPCIVNNEPLKTTKTYPVYKVGTSNQEVLHQVSCVDRHQAIQAVQACQDAFPVWRSTPVVERRRIFLKAQRLFQERISDHVQKLVQETVLTPGASAFDVAVLVDQHITEAASVMSTALKGEILPDGEDGVNKYVFREPFGVVLAIAPGNVPFVLSLRSCLYPLAAGNTCVLKTSELCPRAHLCMAQALLDAGLPKGALSVIHVDPKDAPEVTEAMISHRWVRKVNFTGSTRVGRIIAQTCAKHLKPCVLELGGKAPVLVLEDADLDVAANNIVFGGFFNANQVCMATNNILVHSSVADLLESKISEILQQRVETFTASSLVEDGESRVRCLFNDVAAEKAKSLYDDAISKGAKVVAGKVGFERSTVQPLVLGGVDDSMRIFEEETFAPILSLIRFQHVDQAVEMANANPAGLAASIFTSDLALAFSLAKRIDSGQVHINGQTIHDDPMMPHGGWKESGYGRFNGVDGIRQFTQTKGVTVSRGAKIPFEYM